ncbi:MAG: hypothetical protein R2852_04555 [Bacteroidia bacterium]
MAALQASGRDSNSISSNPTFKSSTDLHCSSVALNGAAKKLSYVMYDIDNELRDSLNPG